MLIPDRFLHILLPTTGPAGPNLCSHGGDVEEDAGLLVQEVGGHCEGHVAAQPGARVKTGKPLEIYLQTMERNFCLKIS